jgi:hypothetical protein
VPDSLPNNWEFHATISLEGPVQEMDEHQKQVEEIAALAGKGLIVEEGPSNNGAVIRHYKVHFEGCRVIDIVLMATGLVGPPRGSGIEIVELVIARWKPSES